MLPWSSFWHKSLEVLEMGNAETRVIPLAQGSHIAYILKVIIQQYQHALIQSYSYMSVGENPGTLVSGRK